MAELPGKPEFGGQRREWLRQNYGDKGYQLCPVLLEGFNACNTPIRPNLYQDPSGRVTSKKPSAGYPLGLRYICEVCYKEKDTEPSACTMRGALQTLLHHDEGLLWNVY